MGLLVILPGHCMFDDSDVLSNTGLSAPLHACMSTV